MEGQRQHDPVRRTHAHIHTRACVLLGASGTKRMPSRRSKPEKTLVRQMATMRRHMTTLHATMRINQEQFVRAQLGVFHDDTEWPMDMRVQLARLIQREPCWWLCLRPLGFRLANRSLFDPCGKRMGCVDTMSVDELTTEARNHLFVTLRASRRWKREQSPVV